jgi:hypothetical protein
VDEDLRQNREGPPSVSVSDAARRTAAEPARSSSGLRAEKPKMSPDWQAAGELVRAAASTAFY